MSTIWSRFTLLVAKYGITRAIARIIMKPFNSALQYFKYTFNNYNFIFKYNPKSPRTLIPEGFSVKQYDKIEKIPSDVLTQLKNNYGEVGVEKDIFYVKQKGCILWVAFLNDNIACKRLSRIATAIPNWFIPLNPQDHVFLRGNTVEQFRGKGVSPALIQHMASQLSKNIAAIYVDCSIHNTANIKSLPKAGFEIIAKMKPIKEAKIQ